MASFMASELHLAPHSTEYLDEAIIVGIVDGGPKEMVMSPPGSPELLAKVLEIVKQRITRIWTADRWPEVEIRAIVARHYADLMAGKPFADIIAEI